MAHGPLGVQRQSKMRTVIWRTHSMYEGISRQRSKSQSQFLSCQQQLQPWRVCSWGTHHLGNRLGCKLMPASRPLLLALQVPCLPAPCTVPAFGIPQAPAWTCRSARQLWSCRIQSEPGAPQAWPLALSTSYMQPASGTKLSDGNQAGQAQPGRPRPGRGRRRAEGW